jgi:putative lipoprotein
MTDPRGREHARHVSGQVTLPADVPAEAAEVVVQVEDVSRADAPSLVVAEHRMQHVHLAGAGVLPFEVAVPAHLIDERMSYSVRVHVDVSGSGQVEIGDLITTQTYPVLTHGFPDRVEVSLHRV